MKLTSTNTATQIRAATIRASTSRAATVRERPTSRCKTRAPSPSPLESFRRTPRGNAELETLLVIPLLLTILFLAGGALKLGTSRLSNTFLAENHAYSQVIAGTDTTPSTDPLPPLGIAAPRPDPILPTRLDYANELLTIPLPIASQNTLKTITIQDQALFLDPTWHYTPQPPSPSPGDQSYLEEWFKTYAAEDHPPTLNTALGLQPAWPP